MTGNLIKLWHNASQSPLPAALFLTLIMLLAYQAAHLTWYWLTPPGHVAALVSFSALDKKSDAASVDANAIASYHLFGEAQQQQAVKVDAVIQAPETKLKLELRGVISSGDLFGAAIIADASKSESYYRVGDQLPGNALLHEVFADKVILDRGGLYETLSLPLERMELSPSQGRASLRGGPNGSVGTAVAPLLREYRELLQNDPQQLMGMVRTFPVRRGSKLVGYRIAPGRDRTLLTKFGLRPGDIVTGVNGISLDSPANGLAVMQKLNSAEALTLEVERNGSTQSFEFSLN